MQGHPPCAGASPSGAEAVPVPRCRRDGAEAGRRWGSLRREGGGEDQLTRYCTRPHTNLRSSDAAIARFLLEMTWVTSLGTLLYPNGECLNRCGCPVPVK